MPCQGEITPSWLGSHYSAHNPPNLPVLKVVVLPITVSFTTPSHRSSKIHLWIQGDSWSCWEDLPEVERLPTCILLWRIPWTYVVQHTQDWQTEPLSLLPLLNYSTSTELLKKTTLTELATICFLSSLYTCPFSMMGDWIVGMLSILELVEMNIFLLISCKHFTF